MGWKPLYVISSVVLDTKHSDRKTLIKSLDKQYMTYDFVVFLFLVGPSEGSEDSSGPRFSVDDEFEPNFSRDVAEDFSAGDGTDGRFFLTTMPFRTGFEGFEGFLRGVVVGLEVASTFLLVELESP